MKLVARGDEAARHQVFEEHGERIWRLLHRLVGDYDDAHDLTQETFLHAFRKAGEFDGRGTLRGWLVRVAVNLTRDELRKRRRRRNLLEARPPARASVRPDPDEAARVHSAMLTLPKGQRTVVVMHEVEGYTHEEIAEALDIAVGTSRARLSRARAHLRDILDPPGNEVGS